MTRPEDLRGEALRMFETWRALGLSETQAMREVAAAGLVPVDGFDRVQRNFEAMGMPPEVARRAAIGRHGSESAAREALGGAGGTSPSRPASAADPLAEAYDRAVRTAQRFGGLSAEQADVMVRRRMADACHAVVAEVCKPGKGR